MGAVYEVHRERARTSRKRENAKMHASGFKSRRAALALGERLRISMIGVGSQRALPNLNEWVRWSLREASGVATSNANAVGTMRPAADRGRNRRGEPDPTSRIQTA